MRCPSCDSDAIQAIAAAGAICPDTGYNDSGPAALCLACGAIGDETDFAERRPALRQIPRPRLRPDPQPLTRRELEVAALVAAAWANKEIAARLGISEQTVKQHLANIFDKLGVRERTSVVLWYVHRVLESAA